jgi:hypothetical protein
MTKMRRIVESQDIESIMDWFEDEIGEGENGTLVYPTHSHSERYICSMLKTNW